MGENVEDKKKIKVGKEKVASEETQKETCFVIMPFGGWFDTYYKDVFHPAIIDAGLQPRRADDIYRTGAIVHDIWGLTSMAKVILADLTGKNPNVLYELGLAHALSKPAIMVTETLDDVPFDLQSLRIIVYDRNEPAWGDILKEKITKSLGEVLKEPQKAIPPAFLDVDKSRKTTKVSPQEKEILELRNDFENLRREVLTRESYTPSVFPSAGPRLLNREEARAKIEEYLSKDMSTEFILERLSWFGYPQSWTIGTINMIAKDTSK